jgi:uncharacterized protein (DUF2384 family)
VPIYIEISTLHRTVTIVARGSISPDEIRGAAQQMLEAKVPHFAKLVDVAGAVTEINLQQVQAMATLLRGRPEDKRGPVAFLIAPGRGEFARAFAATQDGQRAVSLFTSLREAREWLARPHDVPAAPTVAQPVQSNSTTPTSRPWTDPQRQAVLFRGDRRRDVAVRATPSYARRSAP